MTEGFPKPGRRDGQEPCGECHLQAGETCDICGANRSDAPQSRTAPVDELMHGAMEAFWNAEVGNMAGVRAALEFALLKRGASAERELEKLTRQLHALAIALHAKHYASDAPAWQPLEGAEGLLSQIDNMTTGLGRPAEDDVHLWSALQFYADGERDGGLRAQSALECGKPAFADDPPEGNWFNHRSLLPHRRLDAAERLADKVEDLIAEFGADAIPMIGEWIGEWRHARSALENRGQGLADANSKSPIQAREE